MSDELWITTESFDPKVVSISKDCIPKTDRHNVMYTYPNGAYKKLILTFPRTEEAYVSISKPEKKAGKNAGGQPFMPTKHSVTISLMKDNVYHQKMYAAVYYMFESVRNSLNIDCNLAMKNYEDKDCLFCSLVESADQIYTKFYTEHDYIDPAKLFRFIGRPSISFSVNVKTGKIYPQLDGAFCFKPLTSFLLATKD